MGFFVRFRKSVSLLLSRRSPRFQSMALMGGRAVASVLPLVAAVVLVRFLEPEEYGYYGQLILIASTAAAFFSFGIPQSVYYFVARSGSPSQSLVIRSFAALVVCGLVGGITLVAHPLGWNRSSMSRSRPISSGW